MALSKITDLSITDDTIKNADINSSAAIALTKLSGGIDLAASGAGGVTGILPIANGGTAATTLAAAGLSNTPSFSAQRSTAQSISDSVRTTILFNSEYSDSDSAYNTSTGKFTPQTAGKYFVTANVRLDGDANSNYHTGFIELYKNASIICEAVQDDSDSYGRVRSVSVGAIADMNGSSDYLLVQGYIQHETTEDPQINSASTFQAFRVIGA